ncbi:MAG: glucose-6-phosphate dehydrogenase, partial [Anaerolineaceae bacterium]|nr:glucose-6-phosphate dehydrogenase [Anaerolineaceae bacterium]
VLSAVQVMTSERIAENTVRAQYNGYKILPNVAEDSKTPTYAALKLSINNHRWIGVPFYLRSGKNLAQKATEIVIQFKKTPQRMFSHPLFDHINSNHLAICLQPHEGFHQRFEVKVPDSPNQMHSVDMAFHYEDEFGDCSIPDAYEHLLLNAMEGDATLFTRNDGIEVSWRIIDPIIKAWKDHTAPLMASYEPGSWGPKEGDELLAAAGHRWVYGCKEH